MHEFCAEIVKCTKLSAVVGLKFVYHFFHLFSKVSRVKKRICFEQGVARTGAKFSKNVLDYSVFLKQSTKIELFISQHKKFSSMYLKLKGNIPVT